jgi:hypothetical protein
MLTALASLPSIAWLFGPSTSVVGLVIDVVVALALIAILSLRS